MEKVLFACQNCYSTYLANYLFMLLFYLDRIYRYHNLYTEHLVFMTTLQYLTRTKFSSIPRFCWSLQWYLLEIRSFCLVFSWTQSRFVFCKELPSFFALTLSHHQDSQLLKKLDCWDWSDETEHSRSVECGKSCTANIKY